MAQALTSSLEVEDELGYASDPVITKMLEPNEQILLSATLYKYNMRLKRQERNLLITTKAIYNIKRDTIASILSVFSTRFRVRRRIDIRKLAFITISGFNSEFVLHVPSEYDYRYAAPKKRDEILKAIYHAYYLNLQTKPLGLFVKNDINMIKHTTTEQDKKNGVTRIPKDQPLMLDERGLKDMLEKAIQKKEKLKENTEQFFTKDQAQSVTLDDFEMLKVLGRGAFGKVMLVEKKDTKQIYAMKSMHKQDLISKDQIEHIKTERLILERNKSPFMVSLEFAFHTPEKIFFVMEFKQGGELFHHLRIFRRFDEDRAKFYAAEVVLAFEYLHKLGAIYRDLKPENILMDRDGHICLTDFGMAKYVPEGELTKSLVGTPDYWAPEIIMGQGHGSPVDWWALGVLCYEMILGLPPFHNREQNIQQVSKDILNKDVAFGTKVKMSPEAKDFILQLLVKDPYKRLGSKGAQEVKKHPWFSGIDWEKLGTKMVEPPFKPEITHELDVNNFDEQFTTESTCQSVLDGGKEMLKKHQKDFDNFAYTAQHQTVKNDKDV